MNTKRKGSRNEHRYIALLEAAGYRCTRAAASLGVWDVVGIGRSDVVLLQVKTRDWPSAAETARMAAFPTPPGSRRLIHRWRAGQRQPDVREVLP